MGQVAAGVEGHAEDGVAGLKQRGEHALVGLAAGVRLDVGEAAAEELLGAVAGEVLGDVDELAAAVVAPARIALGVLVGHHPALRLHHGAGDDVLGGDQLDLVALAAELVLDAPGDLGVAARRGVSVKKPVSRWGAFMAVSLRSGFAVLTCAVYRKPGARKGPLATRRIAAALAACVSDARATDLAGTPQGTSREHA